MDVGGCGLLRLRAMSASRAISCGSVFGRASEVGIGPGAGKDVLAGGLVRGIAGKVPTGGGEGARDGGADVEVDCAGAVVGVMEAGGGRVGRWLVSV